jgi:TonB family protein
MRREFRSFASIALVLVLGAGAMPSMGQQKPEPSPDRVVIERERSLAEGGSLLTGQGDPTTFERRVMLPGPPPGDFVFLATEMSLGGKVVKGAPYSAQAVTESTQVLLDGNRIINKSVAMIYRDSEGRNRREQTIKAIGGLARGGEPSQAIFISDPVANTSYSIDPKTQIARKLSPMRFKVQAAGGASGSSKSDEPGAAVGYGSNVQQAIVGSEQGDKYRIALESDAQLKRQDAQLKRQDAQLKRQDAELKRQDAKMRRQDAQLRRQVETGAAIGWLDKRNPSAKTEELGKQNINGVEAEGTRTTVTIAPGEIGNERAIEIVSERWFSPELQTIVMSRHSDPRFGENTYQLIDINRTEPARELFQVPVGYKIEESHSLYDVGSGTGTGIGTGTNIRGGALNGKAISLPTPEYPAIARQAQASGAVTVQVTVDEEGNVVSAKATSGHPLLRAAAVAAAQKAKFSTTKVNGEAVKVSGVLTYFFTVQ